MEFFAQLLVNGISIGFLYGMAAMGFVMIFKSSSVLNFAHGELMAFGAFIFLTLVSTAHIFVVHYRSCGMFCSGVRYRTALPQAIDR
jgi:branched-chain amino acid transport system permease protein